MFNRDYLEKLKQYVGKDIQLVESDNEVHIYLDSEIQYFLRKKEQKEENKAITILNIYTEACLLTIKLPLPGISEIMQPDIWQEETVSIGYTPVAHSTC